ncbi:rhodanese-like domain-containing protein [Simkania sp.]|uniref:rhodanese-like domain-containing protein n=1 Tax=Simkania sp. TaxID=34094 RepID=UPI003B5162F0
MMDDISFAEFKEVLKKELPKNQKIIDVRGPGEFQAAHIEGAENIPFKDVRSHKDSLNQLDKIYFYCTAGVRCKQACELLEEEGVDPSKLVHVQGHSKDWEKAGLPVAKGTKVPFSIQRQVYLIAGSLIVGGFILAFAWSRWFLLLPFFVGAGMLYAAVRGVCYTETFLSKMPWNR